MNKSKEKVIEAFGRIIEDKVELDSLCVTLPLVYKNDLNIIEDRITQPTLDDAIKVVEEMHNKESDLITTSYGQVERSYHRSRCGALYEVLTALKGLKGE